MRLIGLGIALTLAAALAAPVFAFDPDEDFDPALWQPLQFWGPTQNPSGIDGLDGTNTPKNGRLGKGDVCYWSWNLSDPYPQRAPFVWHAVDVTRTWWGARSGIPRNVKAVWIHAQVIMTPGAYPYGAPSITYQFRGGGTLELDPAKVPSTIEGVRTTDTLLVPVVDGKIEFRYQPAPWPQPMHPAGATFGQHIIVLSPGR